MAKNNDYVCYVKFEDTGTLLVVPSSDVRDFNPEHSNDFEKDRTYPVFWQEGSKSFDGYFDAFILCMAGSLLELKDKAREVGLKKMPPNYASLLQPPAKPAEKKKSTKRCTNGEVDSAGRRRRMINVLEEVKTSPKKGRSVSKSPKKVCSVSKAPMKGSPVSKSPKKTFSLSSSTPLKDTNSPSFCSSEKKTDSPDEDDDLESTLLVVESEQQGAASPFKALLDKVLGLDHSIPEVESDEEDANSKNNEASNKPSGNYQENTDYDSEGFGSDSADDPDDVTSKIMKENETLRASCKISERERLRLLEEGKVKDGKIRSLQEDLKFLKEDKDKIFEEKDQEIRALLEENKKIRKSISPEAAMLQDENQKLRHLVQGAGELLQTGLAKIKSTKRQLSFDDSKRRNPDSTGPKQSTSGSPSKRVTSAGSTSKEEKLPRPARKEENLSQSPSKPNSKNNGKTSKKRQAEEGLTKKEIEDISERVRKDILGLEAMPVNSSGKIEIGGGLVVNKSRWDDAIKTTKKNSLFITKLSQSTYGTPALKSRTVGQPKESGKKMATPKKVDAFVACLRGKLLAEDPTMPNVDAAAQAAKVILGRKMQDEARADTRRQTLETDKKTP